MTRKIVFAMTGAEGSVGGVASVNRSVLRVLVEISREEAATLAVLSFLEADEDRPSWLPEDVCFQGFGGSKIRFSAGLLKAAARRPLLVVDYVHLLNPVLPLMSMGLLRVVLFAHGREYWRDAGWTERWAITAATLVLTNSDFTLRKMRERLPLFRGRSCPLGLSPEYGLNSVPPQGATEPLELEACDGIRRPIGAKMLLLVARMDPGEGDKGHVPLLEALLELPPTHASAQVVMPGPGGDRLRLMSVARDLGLASRVFLPGYLPSRQMEDLYRRCYAFVMPSQQEGFGLVYLEAMNYAKPCVGCRDDGAEDVIVHGETGYLVEVPRNRRELAAVIDALLSDPAGAARMGLAGFERLHRHFTPTSFEARVTREIRPLLTGGVRV